jgi:hypothetical protein
LPSLSDETATWESVDVPPSTIWMASVITTVPADTVILAISNVESTDITIIDARLIDFIF